MNVKKLIVVFVSIALCLSVLGFTEAGGNYPKRALFTRVFNNRVTGTILGDTLREDMYILDTTSWQHKIFLENAFSPDISKDGKTIVFLRYQDVYETHAEGTDIWVSDSSGKNLRNITKTILYREYNPKISLDGKLVAYSIYTGPFSYDNLCFIGIDGTNKTCIHDVGTFSYNCRIDGDPEGQFCMSDEIGSEDYGITGPIMNVWDLSWVKDDEEGRQSAVFHSHIEKEERGDEIYIAKLHHGMYLGFYKIANGHSPEVSPDGRKISYVNDGKTYIFDLDTKVSEQIPGNCEDIEIRPKWSPDGYKIVTCINNRGYESAALYDTLTSDVTHVTINIRRFSDDPYWFGNNFLVWTKSTYNMKNLNLAKNLFVYNITTKTTKQITDNEPTEYGDTISDYDMVPLP